MKGALGYRPDIEGLRAVAILLVIFAHANVPGWAGGFVGVDVFFVLSGYLITTLLTQEQQSIGRIDFLAFYTRRLRRLMPALLVMLGVSSLLVSLLIFDNSQPQQLTAGGSAAVWASNFYFAFANRGYFDPSSEGNIFLHTWSLGVEEQFYLVWPLLIAMSVNVRRTMGWVFGASLAACVALSYFEPTWAFYMMPTRAWQFALGALVATRVLPTWTGWVGLALILAAGKLCDAEMVYPGWAALVPSIGAALALCARPPVLAVHSLQLIGRVSYSWYLWHWPVLLFGERFMADIPPAPRGIFLVLLSLAIAVASYRLIESPIRKQQWPVLRPRAFVAASVAAMAVISVGSVAWGNNLVHKQNRGPIYSEPLTAVYRNGCDDYYRSDKVKPCGFGDPKGTRTVVLMGDSIALQWFPAVERIALESHSRLIVLTKSGCPMVDQSLYLHSAGRRYVECETWRKGALEELARIKPDLLIMGSSHAYRFSREKWVTGSARVLAQAAADASEVVVLQSTPITTSVDGLDAEVIGWQKESAQGLNNVRFVGMSDLICPDGICPRERNGRPVFRDKQHLYPSFVVSLTNDFRQRLER